MNDMLDFCSRCVAECGCTRWTSQTEPDEIRTEVTPGALRMEAAYRCAAGHRWTTQFNEPLPLHAGLEG